MARNVFPKGVSVTAIINLMKPDGTAFSLQGYTYRLFYGVGSRWSEVTSSTVSGNVVSWVYAGSDQNAIGDYKLKLILYQNDTLFCTLNFNKAFTLYKSAGAANNDEEQEEQATNTVTLFSVAEYYLFQPILPAIGNDKYWYVNGAIVTDSHGEYVSAEHTIRYDPTSKNLIIDEGRVDKDGNSIEQTITDIATALASWASLYEAAEGSSAGSTAGDGSRWGAYKTAEAARNAARETAEGTSSATAGDGTRWGAYKTAEAARESAFAEDSASAISAATSAASRANTAAAEAEAIVDTHRGPEGKSAYQVAVEEGFTGTEAEWLESLEGTGIDDVEQTETSIANGGTNKVRITLTNGDHYDIQIKNGSSSAGLFPTSSALATACPSPKVGDYAFVGDGFPADIYVCATAGTWTDSGEDYDGDNVDLTDYAKKNELDALEHEVDGNLMSVRAKNALLDLFNRVAYAVPDAQSYVDELNDALFSIPQVMIPYVRGGGGDGSYIDTGITPDQTTKVIVWARNWNPGGSLGYTWLFGSRVANQDSMFGITLMNGANTGKLRASFGSENEDLSDMWNYMSDYHKYELSKDGFFVDDVLISPVASETFSNNHNIHLFGLNNAGSRIDTKVPVDICACKIFKNDTLVRDFTPAESPSVGLYDAVSETLFTNDGTGSFTYGKFKKDNYIRLAYIGCSGSQNFDTGIKGGYATPIVAYFRPTGTTAKDRDFFGARTANNSAQFEFRVGNSTTANSTMQVRLSNSNGSIYSGTSKTGSDLVLLKKDNTFDVYENGSAVGTSQTVTSSADFVTSYNVYAFTLNNAGSATSQRFEGRVYFLGFGAERNFVPAKKNNIVGMYDTYNDKFYQSETSIPFVVGPAVI